MDIPNSLVTTAIILSVLKIQCIDSVPETSVIGNRTERAVKFPEASTVGVRTAKHQFHSLECTHEFIYEIVDFCCHCDSVA